MTDGRNLNILQSGRQMLRAFGGVNESYGCSEAELSSSLNFSGRGYPALQTRATRKKVREVQDVNGMYHLNGLVICRGTTLEYTPDADESRAGAVVLENALTDNEKAMTGMGTKVLIWPDKKAFDTVSGELTDEEQWNAALAMTSALPQRLFTADYERMVEEEETPSVKA